jgi:predicted nucleic acid-binding protein
VSGFLLDTNVISELVRAKPEPMVVNWVESTDERSLYLSVLTIGEIRKGIALQANASRRSAIETWLEKALRPRFAGRILPVDEAAAERWGVISAAASRAGSRIPVIDGLIAATALQHNLTLVTRNVSDVAGTGVPVLNPWP